MLKEQLDLQLEKIQKKIPGNSLGSKRFGVFTTTTLLALSCLMLAGVKEVSASPLISLAESAMAQNTVSSPMDENEQFLRDNMGIRIVDGIDDRGERHRLDNERVGWIREVLTQPSMDRFRSYLTNQNVVISAMHPSYQREVGCQGQVRSPIRMIYIGVYPDRDATRQVLIHELGHFVFECYFGRTSPQYAALIEAYNAEHALNNYVRGHCGRLGPRTEEEFIMEQGATLTELWFTGTDRGNTCARGGDSVLLTQPENYSRHIQLAESIYGPLVVIPQDILDMVNH